MQLPGAILVCWAFAHFSLLVFGHPGPHAAIDPVAFARRHELAKRCSGTTLESKRKRHLQRMRKRATAEESSGKNATYVIHGKAPSYDFIKDQIGVLTPEVSDGPYVYPQSQLLRQDIVGNQVGVPLVLDIGVVDVNTCSPMSDVLINIWHCNATGSYSSFTGLDPNTNLDVIYHELTGKHLNGTHGLGDLSWLHTDNETWLRGLWPTDSNGATEFNTIFPGFYVDRAVHIHIQAITNWTVRTNGTVETGNIVNTGQIFFNESLTAEIMAVEPYASHTQISRTNNLDDGIFSVESITGAMTLLDTEPLDGVDNKNGVLGYITFVVDPTKTRDGSTANANPSVILSSSPSAVPSGIPADHA